MNVLQRGDDIMETGRVLSGTNAPLCRPVPGQAPRADHGPHPIPPQGAIPSSTLRFNAERFREGKLR